MNYQALNPLFANIGIESVLRFIRSPRNAEIYNGGVVLILAVIGLALCWACLCLTKQFSKKPAANPRKLFKLLCRAHELAGSERRQLERLARLSSLENPAILMIDSTLWKVNELVIAKKLQPKQGERLVALQRILYDQPRLTAENGFA
jgi:hypothetical protein